MGFTFEEFPNSDYYDSDLREILRYMKEFETKLSGYDEVIAQLQRELQNISGLYDRVAQLEQATSDLAQIRTNISILQNSLTNLDNREKADIAEVKREIQAVRDDLTKFEVELKDVYSYINYNIAVTNNEIKRQVIRLEGLIADLEVALRNELDYIIWRLDQIDTSVLNPWHTVEGRISQDRNVKHIYADLADGCLTAEEYSRFGYTADDYSEFGITARTYARRGKEALHYYWVYSPVHGWRQDINVVLTDVINNCENTMTATRYAEMGLTADEYSAIGLTAKAYYKYNPAKVGVYVEDGIMQSDQYYIQVIDGVVQFTGVEASVDDGMLVFD